MSKIKDIKIEILAPAASYEGMKAAMNAGCDAVYIGGKSFGARAFAKNPDDETMLRAIDEAHIRDKNLYLTVNTLVKEEELMDDLYNYLEKFYLQGLDAVIVQDIGVMNFIHKHFPKLPIHASTQTTITMAEGANLLKELGVTRLVTPRELSFDEIRNIREKSDIEIETFVHGALCYSYSGQCLISSMLGGRSGNRGRCAQPCRMPYAFYSGDSKVSSDQEKYLLSPKDINNLSLIPELIEAGVNSFKIEGRMKRPEYAALVSSVYRKYVDYYLEHGTIQYKEKVHSKEYKQDMLDLKDIYNRGGFSQGYGKTYHGKDMMSMDRPNHKGVYIGEVTSKDKRQLEISFKEDVNAQDVIDIRSKDGESVYEFTLKDPNVKGESLWANAGKKLVDIKIGQGVYRTRNNNLLDRIATDYIENDSKQAIGAQLTAKIGKRLELTLRYKDITASIYQGEVQEAKNRPITKDNIEKQIGKMGDTPYYLDTFEVDMDENIFVPLTWLNELRRDAVELIQKAVIGRYTRTRKDLLDPKERQEKSLTHNPDTLDSSPNNPSTGITVSIQTEEQFYAVLDIDELTAIHGQYDRLALGQLIDMAKKAAAANKKFYISLPQISRLSLYKKMDKELHSLIEENLITGFVVKNLEEVALLQPYIDSRLEIISNYSFYLFNSEARKFYKKLGLNHYTASLELNYQELKKLGVEDCDIVVYGHLPLMVSAQCLYENTDKCKPCQEEDNRTDYLLDRLGERFYVQTNCRECYNTILNGQSLSLLNHLDEIRSLNPRNIRLDFTIETKEEVRAVTKSFVRAYYGDGNIETYNPQNYTTGHFKRGVE